MQGTAEGFVALLSVRAYHEVRIVVGAYHDGWNWDIKEKPRNCAL